MAQHLNELDIAERARVRGYKLTAMDEPEDLALAREIRRINALHERWIRSGITTIAIAALVVVGGLCVWASLDQSFTPQQQQFANSVLFAEITGILGYVTGHSRSKSE